MNQRLIPILILSALSTFACGGGDGTTGYTTEAPDGCTPGTTQVCAGPGACSGAQVCSEDGTYWGECVCGTGTGGDPGTGGVNPVTGGTDPGTGGVVNPPGGTGGTGGTGGATGGSPSGGTGGDVCVPKTCEQAALDLTGWNSSSLESAPIACGLADDGCGGLIDCGTCLGGFACDEPSVTTNGAVIVQAQENICASRCALNPFGGINLCDRHTNPQPGKQWWVCSDDIRPIFSENRDCVNMNSSNQNVYCCNPAP